jgi:hypothetical protein
MPIRDVCLQEPQQEKDQPSTVQAQPLTQDEEQEAQDDDDGQGGG